MHVVFGSCKSRYEFTKNKQGAGTGAETTINDEEVVPYVPSTGDPVDDGTNTTNSPNDGLNNGTPPSSQWH
jgi:hypothetical protein